MACPIPLHNFVTNSAYTKVALLSGPDRVLVLLKWASGSQKELKIDRHFSN